MDKFKEYSCSLLDKIFEMKVVMELLQATLFTVATLSLILTIAIVHCLLRDSLKSELCVSIIIVFFMFALLASYITSIVVVTGFFTKLLVLIVSSLILITYIVFTIEIRRSRSKLSYSTRILYILLITSLFTILIFISFMKSNFI